MLTCSIYDCIAKIPVGKMGAHIKHEHLRTYNKWIRRTGDPKFWEKSDQEDIEIQKEIEAKVNTK